MLYAAMLAASFIESDVQYQLVMVLRWTRVFELTLRRQV